MGLSLEEIKAQKQEKKAELKAQSVQIREERATALENEKARHKEAKFKESTLFEKNKQKIRQDCKDKIAAAKTQLGL